MTQLATPATTTQLPKNDSRRSRRRAPKGSTRALVYPNAMGLGGNIGVRVLDVSETGARLLVKSALAPRQQFTIELEAPGARSLRLLATAVWCLEAADGNFVVGAEFQKLLCYLDLLRLAKV
jgi:hypothetical protein